MQSLYIYDDFVIDNEMIAVIATDDCEYGKSIVFHLRLGVFFINRTTKELMNEYYKVFSYGFELSRSIARHFGYNRHLPLVNGGQVYMPMSGKKNGNPDWVGLHLISDYKQTDSAGIFTSIHDEKFGLKFLTGDLHQKIHHACVFSEFHLKIVELCYGQYGKPEIIRLPGITAAFEHCQCEMHQALPSKLKDLKEFRDLQAFSLCYVLSRDDIGITQKQGAKIKMRITNEMKRW